jgi:hypothetical protein
MIHGSRIERKWLKALNLTYFFLSFSGQSTFSFEKAHTGIYRRSVDQRFAIIKKCFEQLLLLSV